MTSKWLFWLPRALVMLFALLTALFSLDVFSESAPWHMVLLGFLIHNIPFFVLMLFLLLSWKRPLVGAILFLIVAIFMVFFVKSGLWWVTLIFVIPPLVVAVLFFMEHRRIPA